MDYATSIWNSKQHGRQKTECREKMANKQNPSPFPFFLSFVVFFPLVQANCSFDNRNYENSICVCMPNVTSTFK